METTREQNWNGHLRLQIYKLYNILPVILDITWDTQDTGNISHLYLEILNISTGCTFHAIIDCTKKEQCLHSKLAGNDFQTAVYGLKRWDNGFIIVANSRFNMVLFGIGSRLSLALSKDWEYYPMYKPTQLRAFATVRHVRGSLYKILGSSPTNISIAIIKEIPSSTVYVFPLSTLPFDRLYLRPATKYSFYIHEGKRELGLEVKEYMFSENFTKIENVTSYMTKFELNKLQTKAINFICTSGNTHRNQTMSLIGPEYRYNGQLSFVRLPYFYRNKPNRYFEDIFQCHGGIMRPYIKDMNGDPGSVINNNIDGLFFSGIVDQYSRPPQYSYFGNIRVFVKAECLFNIHSNLYFADFYCHYTSHYVTLVLTKNGSETDSFCRLNLLCLDKFDNPFLKISPSNDVNVTRGVGIEILCTEPVDLRQDGIRFHRVSTRGRGSSRLHGIPKNPNCSICNLS